MFEPMGAALVRRLKALRGRSKTFLFEWNETWQDTASFSIQTLAQSTRHLIVGHGDISTAHRQRHKTQTAPPVPKWPRH